MSAGQLDASEERSLLDLIEEVAAELRAGRRRPARMETKLEDDLGLDSLARMELLLRIQRRFGVTLPEQQALGTETPADLTPNPSRSEVATTSQEPLVG